MTTTTNGHPVEDPAVPVGPVLSMYDPVYLGADEYAEPVYATMIYRNMLIGGEPGGGKSTLLSSIIAHAALSSDCRLCLLDGKQVELGMWAETADVFVGPNIGHATATLRRLQTVMDNRYTYLLANGERKITRGHELSVILCAVDEIAYFSATIGTRDQQEEFIMLLRDLVARGRAVGLIVAAATQRPSFDIIPTSLRDLFSWRFATRCTTEASSDIVLGRGWAEQGYNAQHITPEQLGVGLLLAEGGVPRLIRGAYLSDQDITQLARYATWTRNPPAPQAAPAPPRVRRRRPAPHPITIPSGKPREPDLAEVTP